MIQIDIPMPDSCASCPCLRYGEYGAFEKSWCALNSGIRISERHRPKECPIKAIELPKVKDEWEYKMLSAYYLEQKVRNDGSIFRR